MRILLEFRAIPRKDAYAVLPLNMATTRLAGTKVGRGEVLSLYRNLLRHIDKGVTKISKNHTFRDFVRSEFKNNRLVVEPEAQYGAFLVGHSALTLMQTSNELMRLWTLYDMLQPQEYSRDKLKRNAQAVGLSLPEFTAKEKEKTLGDHYHERLSGHPGNASSNDKGGQE